MKVRIAFVVIVKDRLDLPPALQSDFLFIFG